MSDTELTIAHELFPRSANLVEFCRAFELHKAACAIRLEQNSQTKAHHPALSDEQLAQRVALLEVPLRLVLNSRDKVLDKFCRDWVKARPNE